MESRVSHYAKMDMGRFISVRFTTTSPCDSISVQFSLLHAVADFPRDLRAQVGPDICSKLTFEISTNENIVFVGNKLWCTFRRLRSVEVAVRPRGTTNPSASVCEIRFIGIYSVLTEERLSERISLFLSWYNRPLTAAVISNHSSILLAQIDRQAFALNAISSASISPTRTTDRNDHQSLRHADQTLSCAR